MIEMLSIAAVLAICGASGRERFIFFLALIAFVSMLLVAAKLQSILVHLGASTLADFDEEVPKS